MVIASRATVGHGTTLRKVVNVIVTEANVKVASRIHGCGIVRNTMAAVPPVPHVCKPEQSIVGQAEQQIASASVRHQVQNVRLLTGSTHQRLPESCVGAAIDENQV